MQTYKIIMEEECKQNIHKVIIKVKKYINAFRVHAADAHHH
jgi:hypothetical protein